MLDKIKNIFKGHKIKNIFKSLEKAIPYFLPENWAKNRKEFLLFWIIASFTIIFVIWASVSEVNQVVRATGTVIPDSKVHLVQSMEGGPVEEINIALGDKVIQGDVLFLVDYENKKNMYLLTKSEVETRSRKVEIIESLVSKGSDSEFRLLDEKLALIESKKRHDIASSQFEQSSVTAPVTGVISKMDVTNIDQVVQKGALLAEIVPEDDKLKIEAAVLPKDIAYVRIGQKAMVGFSAYDQAIYGRLEGVVQKVAANTTENQDFSYYPIIIEIDETEVPDDSRIVLQSGLVSDVSIIGEERTVMSYIINPITKLSQNALRE